MPAAPTVHQHPASQTAYDGQYVTLSSQAGGTSASPQWERSDNAGADWNDIGGATSSHYRRQYAQATEDGAMFRCKWTNAGGTTTSNAATITVWHPADLGSDYVWIDTSTGCFTERTGASATTAATDGSVVGTIRDSAAAINGVATSDGARGTFDTEGMDDFPGVVFDGTTDFFSFTTDLAAFTAQKSYVYIFANVRITDVSTSERSVFVFATAVGNGRCYLMCNAGGTAGTITAFGRKTDGGSPATASVANGFIAGERMTLGAEFRYGAAECYLRKNGVRVAQNLSFHTAGSTDNTNSSGVFMGANAAGTASFWNGTQGDLILVAKNSELTSQEIAHIEAFLAVRSGGPTFDWSLNTRSTGVLSALTVDSAVVGAPTGATPTENDMATHKYRHPNKIIRHWGRVHIQYDCSGTNEHGAGGQEAYAYSDDDGATWSAPLQLFPAQSTWTATATSFDAGTHVVTCRDWVVLDGRLFATSAILLSDGDVLNDRGMTGVALIAREVFDDATFGTPFRLTSEDYTALDGKTKYAYDNDLSPRLFPRSSIYGTFGGTATGYSGATFDGYAYQETVGYYEKWTAQRYATDAQMLIRTHRNFTGGTAIVYQRESHDGGTTWGRVKTTNMPSSPSPAAMVRLHDGRIAIAANMDANRTELYLAIVDEDTLKVTSAGRIKTGVSTTPVYAGTHKGGGASYVSMQQAGNYLYCCWSERKEDIYFGRVLIPGLSDNDNDANSIDVTGPALGATLTTGSSANVTATESGTSGDVDILLSIDGGLTFPITLATSETVPYAWTPTAAHVSSECVIRVVDSADENVFGDSLTFEVEEAESGGVGGAIAPSLNLLGVM